MGLSSLFKPKPMISLVLTKEVQDPSREESEFSSFEARLDMLGCKLQKLKKYSKKVFECNNLETLSAVEECCTRVKKERCKAKKQRTCRTKACSKSPDEECAMDGESMEIDDFSCGDQLTISGESGDECEDDTATCPEEEGACEDDDNDKCEEQEDECEEEEEEKDECEEEIKKCSCENEEDDKDDKCTQVMTFEPKGSSYLVSQIEFEKEYISKPHPLSPSFTSTKAPLKSEKKSGSNKIKAAKNNSFVIPIITTTSARSLSKASCSTSKTCSRGLKDGQTEDDLIEERSSLNKQSLQTCNVQSSSQVEEESKVKKIPSVLQQGKNRSRSLSRGSRLSFKKEPLRSASAGKTLRDSRISKVNEESSSKEYLLNEYSQDNAQPSTSNMSDPYSENKQQSIVYIVQTPPNQNETSLTNEGTIHIDASKVYIQNSTSTAIQSGSFVGTANQKPVILKKQKSSEREVVMSEIIAAPSDKIESKVSFQQPEVIECPVRQMNLLGLNKADKSTTSTNPLYDNSSKIISNIEGPTSQTLMASNIEVTSKESRLSQTDTVKASQEQFASDCSFIKPSQVQFASDCEIYYSNSGKKLLVKGTPKGSSATSHSKDPSGSLSSFNNSTGSSDRKQITNEFESQTFNSNISQRGDPDIQVQSTQLSRSSLEKNNTSKVSQVSSAASAGCQTSTPMKEEPAKSQTQVTTSTTMNIKPNNPLEKASFNVLPNISGTKESLGNVMPKQMSSYSRIKLKNCESAGSSPKQSNMSKVKVSGASTDTSRATNSSSKSIQHEEILFVDTTVGFPGNQNKEFLVVHCSKCKEVCIAKIVEKKQSPHDIWVGRGK